MTGGESVLEQVTEKVPSVRSPEGFIQTEPFLSVCRLVLPVVDKLGTPFAMVKSDISGNIERLAAKATTDPSRYSHLFVIVQDEVVAGTSAASTSCTKGLLWLKRAMEFMLAIIQATNAKPQLSLPQVVQETYTATLMRFHGFIVSSAFTVS
ncbi:GLTP domain-containing protein, partial [Haematococcus lacustris]